MILGSCCRVMYNPCVIKEHFMNVSISNPEYWLQYPTSFRLISGLENTVATQGKRPSTVGRSGDALAITQGEVAEWPKALVLKTSEPKGSVGSNPTLTAKPE